MMNDPIVVWPPGTFYITCDVLGPYYDCTHNFPGVGNTVCCLAW
jgi:hypothetical protein